MEGSFCVVEIVADGLPVYVAVERAGQPFVGLAWAVRWLVCNPLMAWLRTLPEAPESRVAIGRYGLAFRAVRHAMRFRRGQIAAMSGAKHPDFALWLPAARGWPVDSRPVCRVLDGIAEPFASVTLAAIARETGRANILEFLDGRKDERGHTWWEGGAAGPKF